MIARRPVRLVLAAALVLSGCTALLDVKEIFLDPSIAPGGEGGVNEASTTDAPAGQDGGSCDADLKTDKKNCGRCGHDCLGGTCDAGTCQAVELGTIASAPLYDVAVSSQHVFVGTRIALAAEVGGIWRVLKGGGAPEAYVTMRDAQGLAVLGETLYFVVHDAPANGTTQQGGLYSCPVAGASPCAPTLIAAATNPRALTVDKGKVFYGDSIAGRGLMVYAPPAAPVSFREGFGFAGSYFVDGTTAFYPVTIEKPPRRAKVFELVADAAVETYFYENPKADVGLLKGTATFLLFAAFDAEGTEGGVVRRIPRAGGPAPCDYGAGTNKRPYGVYADATHVYWTNQGEGATQPYGRGSLVRCELAGCCATPDVMWTGNGQPTAVTADADAVYFTTKARGSVWRIAKP